MKSIALAIVFASLIYQDAQFVIKYGKDYSGSTSFGILAIFILFFFIVSLFL